MGFYKSFRIANILTNLFSSKNIAKIVLFGVILLIIGLLFSNNVLAYENNVEFKVKSNVVFDDSTHKIASGTGNIYYVKSETNKIYSINNIDYTAGLTLRMTTSAPDVGVDYVTVTYIAPGESYNWVGNDNYYCEIVHPGSTHITYTWQYVNSTDNTVGDMVSTFSGEQLWSQFGFAIPLIGVAVLFAIGFIIVRKLTKGTSKGKVKF